MFRLTIISIIIGFALTHKLRVVYEWSYIDYVWESIEQKHKAIVENRYNYTRIFTFHVEKVPDGRVFITTPAQFPNAAPATLSTISKKKGPGGPLLKPYPNWKWHNSANCTGITSVWKVAVDDCERLWVVDGGKVENKQVCPAQVLLFDLKTDELLRRIEVPDNIWQDPKNRSIGRLSSPIVETHGNNCNQTWVYFGIFEGGGLAIYDGSKLWRRDDDVFLPSSRPKATNFSIAGEKFNPLPGLFGLALMPAGRETAGGSRRLFFRSSSYVQQNSVSVDDLQKLPPNEDICSTTSKYRFSSPFTGQAFSQDILFFGMTGETAIGCWNIGTPLTADHVEIVAQDNTTLQYVSSIQITKCPDNPAIEELWATTDRIQKLWAGTLNFNEMNFRVLRGSVDNLVKGSKCDLRGNSWSSESSEP